MNQNCNDCEHLRRCVNGAYCMEQEKYIEYQTGEQDARKCRFSSLSALNKQADD